MDFSGLASRQACGTTGSDHSAPGRMALTLSKSSRVAGSLALEALGTLAYQLKHTGLVSSSAASPRMRQLGRLGEYPFIRDCLAALCL